MPLTIPSQLTKFSPLTKITLYKLRDIDSSYSNVHRFKDRDERKSYFSMSFNDPLDFDSVKPVRTGGRKIRLNLSMDYVKYYNYLSFHNLNFSRNDFDDRVYYCFITEVDWININCCEITFEIDVWATYYFDIIFNVAYCERSHYYCTTNEQIGDNVEPETGYYSEYQFLDVKQFAKGTITPRTVCVYYADSNQYLNFDNNYYCGLAMEAFKYPSEADLINSLIDSKGERVQFVVQIPDGCYESRTSIKKFTFEEITLMNKNDIGGYEPINKKLFTYPYNYLMVYTSSGDSKIYKYEFFENLEVDFIAECGHSPDGFISFYPNNYKLGGFNDRLILGDYPHCPTASNAYMNWINNGGLISSISGVAKGTTNGAIYNGEAGAAAGAAQGLMNVSSTSLLMLVSPPLVNGSIKSSSDVVTDRYGIYIAKVALIEQELARMDEFFNRYGYADNSLRRIDPKICKFWNYWKTSGNAVSSIDYTSQGGGAPSWAVDIMNKSFQKGITFWDIMKPFGNYQGDNRDNRSIEPVKPQSIDFPVDGKIERSDNVNVDT